MPCDRSGGGKRVETLEKKGFQEKQKPHHVHGAGQRNGGVFKLKEQKRWFQKPDRIGDVSGCAGGGEGGEARSTAEEWCSSTLVLEKEGNVQPERSFERKGRNKKPFERVAARLSCKKDEWGAFAPGVRKEGGETWKAQKKKSESEQGWGSEIVGITGKGADCQN